MGEPVVAARPAARHPSPPGVETLFVSDLHLSPEEPATTALFRHFLTDRARRAQALYVLGDLFDAWVGDDDDCYADVEQDLAALTASGTRCGVMRGNRDFLLGRRFARRTGCELLADPTLIRLDGEAVLLMHGDLLCTDDIPYQRFRRRMRNPLAQWLFLLQPLPKRRRIAADYRQKSGAATAAKTAEIMDVNQQTVARYLRQASSARLIHGHTHRPADHRFQLDGAHATRQVLAQWHPDHGEVLVHRNSEWLREPIAARS
jgi:UDP-2,3-diacylglucosamine hydrolase